MHRWKAEAEFFKFICFKLGREKHAKHSTHRPLGVNCLANLLKLHQVDLVGSQGTLQGLQGVGKHVAILMHPGTAPSNATRQHSEGSFCLFGLDMFG